jgi:hypothetical protein
LLLHTLDARGIVGAHVNVTYLCSVSLLVDGCFFFAGKLWHRYYLAMSCSWELTGLVELDSWGILVQLPV